MYITSIGNYVGKTKCNFDTDFLNSILYFLSLFNIKLLKGALYNKLHSFTFSVPINYTLFYFCIVKLV